MKNFIYTIGLVLFLIPSLFAQSDNCSTATPFTLTSGSGCVNGTTSGGTADNITTTCNASPSVNFVWYQFTCTGTNNTITLTPGTLQNAVMVVDGTTCTDGTIDFCNNATGSNPITILNGQTVGTTVLVSIGSTSGNNGTFQLCINSVTPTSFAGGDICSNAILYCDASVNPNFSSMSAYTGVGAGGKPSCFTGPGSNPVQDMFITFTAYSTGTIAWLANPNTTTSEFDWALYNITSGCPGTQLSCNYNWSNQVGANFGMAGAVNSGEFNATINAVVGQTYAIFISNWSGNGSGFVFDWTGTAQIAPTASFTINPNTVTCGASVNVTINNTSTASANWTYGDGGTYTGTTPPAHLYSTPGTYPITATIPGSCPSTATQYVNLFGPLAGTVAGVDATCPASCDGSASVTSISGGDGIYTYLWSGPSQNGATTPSISSLCPGNYSVTISNAVCGTNIVLNTTIGVTNAVDNPSFTLTNYCFGAANSATITGTTGGTFTFNPVPGGGVTINGTTGAITNGVAGATYTVQYTTAGACPASSTQNVNVLAIDNPSFTLTNYCAGTANSATITGTSGGTFTFNPAPSDGATVNPTSGSISNGIGGTTYTLQYTTSGTCPASSTQNVTVNANPTFTLSDTDPTVCGGLDGTLIISGLLNSSNYSVSYMDDAAPIGPNTFLSNGSGTITISGQNAGTYSGFSVTLNSTGCNGTSATVLSLVDPGAPVLTITNPAAVCSPSSVDLTLPAVTSGSTAGTLSYWTDAGATTVLVGPSAVTVSGTYYIQLSNMGCSDIEPVVVTVNQTPNLVITDPTAVCSPSTVDLTAAAVTSGSTNVGTLSYWTNAGATTALGTPASVGTSGTYYIQATNNGCTDINPVGVTVNATPVLTITNPSAVCSPSTVDITAAAVTTGSTNPGTLSYWNDLGATSAMASPSTISASGTYYIQGTNAGCSDIEAVVVTVNQTPNLVITDPAAVCSPSTVDLTAAAVTSGSTNVGTLSYWTNAGATIALGTPASVGTSGTYYIQATNNGCTDINPVGVTVNASPVLTITNPSAVCSPSTVDITAAAVTAGSTNPGTLSYWNDLGATSAMASPSTISASGTYYIQGTNAGCSDIEAVVVTVNQTPNLVITDPSAVCSPSTVDLTAAAVTSGSTNVGTLSYWTNAGATTSLGSSSSVATSGTYYIQATNNGCTDINAVNVTVNASPNLVITNPSPVCSPATVDMTLSAITVGSTNLGTLTYWTDAAATNSLATPTAVGTSGTYYIQANNAGCMDLAPVTVTISVIPPAPSAGTDTTYCTSWEFVPMTAMGTGGTITWYMDAALTSVTTSTPSNNLGTTVYYVTETVATCEGPASTVTITIENCEIIIPTAFTPDNDGVNDVWEILDLDAVYSDNVVMVFNRWGNKLYESEKGAYASRPWDGTFEGDVLPVGSYYFIIDFNEEGVDARKGVVSVIFNK